MEPTLHAYNYLMQLIFRSTPQEEQIFVKPFSNKILEGDIEDVAILSSN